MLVGTGFLSLKEGWRWEVGEEKGGRRGEGKKGVGVCDPLPNPTNRRDHPCVCTHVPAPYSVQYTGQPFYPISKASWN